MKVETSEIGGWQCLELTPENDIEKTILHNLVDQLPCADNRSSHNRVYVRDAEYNLAGPYKVTLTNTTPVVRWQL